MLSASLSSTDERLRRAGRKLCQVRSRTSGHARAALAAILAGGRRVRAGPEPKLGVRSGRSRRARTLVRGLLNFLGWEEGRVRMDFGVVLVTELELPGKGG